MSRRKTHVLSFRDLSDEDVAAVQKIFEAKGVRVDPRTLTLTAAAPHHYVPRGFPDFLRRLRRYVEINGNRIVNRSQLAAVGRVPRTTINTWINKYFILPAGVKFYEPIFYPEPEEFYTDVMAEIDRTGDPEERKALRLVLGRRYNLNTFDLQKIIDANKYTTEMVNRSRRV